MPVNNIIEFKGSILEENFGFVPSLRICSVSNLPGIHPVLVLCNGG